MELILILLWMVVVLLSYQLWVIRKTHGLILQLLKELSDRFRGGIRSGGRQSAEDHSS